MMFRVRDSSRVFVSLLRPNEMTYPLLHFTESFDERARDEMEMKGYCNGVTVELENGDRYPVFFYDPVRLRQDLQAELKGLDQGWGRSYLAEVGMIVIPSVTEHNMRVAVQKLYEEDWFSNFKPLREG